MDVRVIGADLAPLVFDPKIGFALLVITAVEAKVQPPGIETGTVRARVVEVLRPDVPRAGESVSFPFARDADEGVRVRNGANAWNTLRLERDARLLVAWTAVDAPRGEYSLVAAASRGEPDVAELKESIAIQAMPADSPERRGRLAEALIKGKGILRRYSCAAVGSRRLVPREEGVTMMREAIESERTDAGDDLALAYTLIDPPLFDAEKGDDEANTAILTTLAREMVTADAEHAPTWLTYLYSRVMPALSDDPEEDRSRRRALLRSIGVAKGPVSERLKKIMKMPVPEASRAAELLGAWEEAKKD